MTPTTVEPRYLEPGRPTRVFNVLVTGLTRLGVSVWGSRMLAVRGRRSGQWRTTPVNVLTLDGERYLVAPRGEAQWVRNIRVAGGGELRVGRRVEEFTATPVPDDDKPAILRAYLTRWRFEVGAFFDGITPNAPTATLRTISPTYPIFHLTPTHP